jgi:hypothetical protein
MTPEPPPSSDGSSPPPRHRLAPENFAKDTTEVHLWDFDGDFELPEKPAVTETTPSLNREIPVRRVIEVRKPRETQDRPAFKPFAAEDSSHVDVNTRATASRPAESTAKALPPAITLDDDLEDWDDIDIVREIEDLPAIGKPGMIQASASNLKPSQSIFAKSAPEPTVQATAQAETDDEFSPVLSENAVPISLRPRLGLSNVERIGLIGLLALLLGGGAMVYFMFLQPLAQQTAQAKSVDFPVKGSKVTIISAKSYWRAPVTDGDDTDAFRRGTVLLPVLELAVTGGPADIRVFFRDEAGQIVGDAMTRNINGGATLKIAATAGFDDPGMHAAYRTGESKPWTIEVRETPSGASSDREFTKLFEINISTERQ